MMKRQSRRKVLKTASAERSEQVKKNQKTPCHWSQIRWDEYNSEFEVQSFIYWKLREKGFDVRGEVMATTRSKFDLVVFSEDKTPLRIIEVKKVPKAVIVRSSETGKFGNQIGGIRGQIRKYLSYQIPVDLVCGMADAKRYVESFDVGMTSSIPVEFVPLQGWSGIITSEEWVSGRGDIKARFMSVLTRMRKDQHPKSKSILEVLKFDGDLGALFCKVYGSNDTLRCILEITHGVPSEPDDLAEKRKQEGRRLAAAFDTWLIRVSGEIEAKKVCRHLKKHGKNTFSSGSDFADKESVNAFIEARKAKRERAAKERQEMLAVDSEFAELVSTF